MFIIIVPIGVFIYLWVTRGLGYAVMISIGWVVMLGLAALGFNLM